MGSMRGANYLNLCYSNTDKITEPFKIGWIPEGNLSTGIRKKRNCYRKKCHSSTKHPSWRYAIFRCS